MAKIPLRDYLSGIEELIDGGQTEEALAHCRHILETYPKHIDTYRLMGKAYLEAHQHKEAADLFQRVLSSCPDDFVCHIGMSIIREDAGEQDQAIWHMERAFEAQPSNRAVQDELRRLYGKREGYAPPKVRLTRGALARMYAHGDLYNQAIGELRGALAEDAQRPDLQVLLAEMYFKTNRQTEAMEVCSQLIEKIPYCLYANRLMAHILSSNQRDVEAKPYLDRVEELDPYAAQADTETPPSSVAADSVEIEQLVTESPQPASVPVPKAWTASLDAQVLAAGPKEDLPDWLSFDEPDEKEEPEVTELPDAEPSVLGSLESLEPAAPAVEETPVVPAFSKTPTSALADDQVPDWLRELGPATGTLPPLDEPEDELPKRWTDSLETRLPDPADEPVDEIEPETTPVAELPDTAPNSETKEDEDSLSWLEALAEEQGAAEEELLTSPEDRQQAKPEWAPQEEAAPAESDALAWLDNIEKKQEETKDIAEPLPAAFEPEAPEVTPEPTPEPEAAPSEDLTTPSWLRDLSAEVEEKAKPAQPVEPRAMEEAPDWLSDLRRDGEDELPSEPIDAPSLAEPEPPNEEPYRLDWLSELGQPKPQPQPSAWIPEAELAPAPEEAETAPIPVEPEPALEPTPAAAPAASAPSARRTARLEAAELSEDWLEQARQALNYGKVADASQQYGQLLRRRLLLPEVIADLEAALRRNSRNATLWQTLGDAYMRNNQLRQALECYTKAEELL